MTEEQLKKRVVASVAAATALVVFLLIVIVFQLVTIGVKNNRMEKLQQEITRLEKEKEDKSNLLEYYKSEEALYNLARGEGYRPADSSSQNGN